MPPPPKMALLPNKEEDSMVAHATHTTTSLKTTEEDPPLVMAIVDDGRREINDLPMLYVYSQLCRHEVVRKPVCGRFGACGGMELAPSFFVGVVQGW